MHADRTNRAAISLIGLIALALGVGGLLAAAGVFGHRFQHEQLFSNGFSRYVGDHGTWLWPAIAAVTLVLVILALVWLLRLLFSTDRTSSLSIPTTRAGDGGDETSARGRTTMTATALSSAVTNEIDTYRGVTSSRARLIGTSTQPTLAVNVTVSSQADLASLIRRIEDQAIAHARQALDNEQLPAKVDIAVTDKKAPSRAQ